MNPKQWTCLFLAALMSVPCGLLRAEAPAAALNAAAFEIGRLGGPQAQGATLLARRASVDEDLVEEEPADDAGSEELKRKADRAVSRNQRGSRRSRVRAEREHKPLVGLIVAGGILAVAGLLLTIDGFRNNPQPGGTVSVTSFNYYGSGTTYDLDPRGTMENTGNCTDSYVNIRMGVYSSGGSYLGSLSYNYYYPPSPGTSTTWSDSRTDYYNWGAFPYSMRVTGSTWYSDGTYAMNNGWEGTGGIVCVALGITGLIIGLTHTQDVMADNGVEFKLQRADAGQVTLAASKTF